MLKMILNNLIPVSVRRFFRKIQVADKVLSEKHFNDGCVNIYRIDKNNTGDFYCAPYHYFDELNAVPVEILDYKNEKDPDFIKWLDAVKYNSVIIGGGGLFNRKAFKMPLHIFEKLGKKGKKTVIWGAGHNSPHKKDFKSGLPYNADLSGFGLVGLRDYSYKKNWVPCVSCMHPAFDASYDETREIGVILHRYHSRKKNLPAALQKFSRIDNSAGIDTLVRFIGNSHTIITDSYHAMYWAMLLEKKVLVIPNSSKFFDFKYNPVFTTFDKALDDLNKGQSYSGVLEECRSVNIDFRKKVSHFTFFTCRYFFYLF